MKNLFASIAMSVLAVVSVSAATITDGLMTTQPEGTLKVYDRGGWSYYVNGDYARRGAQTGTISIVFAENNEVYILDPLSKAPTGVWMKGSLSEDGKTITLPLGQAIAKDDEMNDDIVLGTVEFDEEEEEMISKSIEGTLTYTIDAEGTIKLNGTSKYLFLGAVWKTSKLWATFGDYESKYIEKKAEDVPVVAPAGLKTEKLTMSAHTFVADKNIQYSVYMGMDQDTVYLKGLYVDLPESWIKGVKKDDKITFAAGQFLAPTHSGTTNYYMIAVNHNNTKEIQDFVLTYDDQTKCYTSEQFLVLNTAKTTVYLVEAYDKIVIEQKAADGAYAVPYLGTFTGGLNDYTVIDANNDKVTWTANKLNGTVEYNWSLKNNADDWLITPLIKLEAGKTYTVTVSARSMAGLLEKFEIKMGLENTAAAMTTTVMDTTEVKIGDFTDFGGEVKASADGAYCFGIHAVSDADNNGLYLQSIKVEEKEVTNGIESIGAPTLNAVKFVEKGQFYLLRNGIRYNASGAKLD